MSIVLLDEIVVGSEIDKVVFGPSGDGSQNPTLDGEHYMIKGTLLRGSGGGATNRVEILPNSTLISGNGAGGLADWDNAGAPAALTTHTQFRASDQIAQAAPVPMNFEFEFVALAGVQRQVMAKSWQNDRVAAYHSIWRSGNSWEDTATAIVSFEIRLNGAPANGLGVGSRFSLYEVIRTP